MGGRLAESHNLTAYSQLKSIAVSPDPPVPGKNLTVSVEADVLEVIEVSVFSGCICASPDEHSWRTHLTDLIFL